MQNKYTLMDTNNYSDHDLGGHFHTDNRGYIHRCFHSCRNLLTSWQFWLGTFLSFPIEHYIWLHCPLLSIIGQYIMGN